MDSLTQCDRYLAKSDYLHLLEGYADIYGTFRKLQETMMLEHYCDIHNFDKKRVENFIITYLKLSEDKDTSIINEHNEKFIAEHLETDKAYLDTILKQVDPAISLDEEQRRVVLSDEDYTLVIAGAGAGKTTTVAAKVKYLWNAKELNQIRFL